MAKRLSNEKGEYPLEFTANGRKYRRLTADDEISIYRFTVLHKLASQAQLGMSATQVLEVLGKVKAGIWACVTDGKNSTTHFFRSVAMMEELDKAIRGEVKHDYHLGFYIAAVFIVRDGEDLTKFVQEEQQAKIDDWNAEGYDARDFFALALSEAPKFLGQ
jgi:hypothetical protein